MDWGKTIDAFSINEMLKSTAMDPVTRNEWAKWLSRNTTGIPGIESYADIDLPRNDGSANPTNPILRRPGGEAIYSAGPDTAGRLDYLLDFTSPNTAMNMFKPQFGQDRTTAQNMMWDAKNKKDIEKAQSGMNRLTEAGKWGPEGAQPVVNEQNKKYTDPNSSYWDSQWEEVGKDKYYSGLNWMNEAFQTADLALGADVAGQGPTRATKGYVAGHLDKLNKEHDTSFGAAAPYKTLVEDILNPITSDARHSSIFGHARTLSPKKTKKYGIAGYGQAGLY
jgi:hypothetical protein